MRNTDFSLLHRVNQAAVQQQATIRQQPADFQVTEQLPFSPDGEGGHVMLLIEKINTNTDWLAKQLAIFAGVDEVAIGYTGLKDRHAITRQWFTVKTEGITEPDWQQFNSDHWQIITQTRHKKKLKRGVLSGNQFVLRLTHLTGDQTDWLHALEQIRRQGVPNYYGEQRFGHHNLDRVNHWFQSGVKPKKRQQRSLYLSAARSWLFNLVLAERIALNNWNQALAGEQLQLNGTHSQFYCESVTAEIEQRITGFDIHPTGPLWGRGRTAVSENVLELETQVLSDWQDWREALERNGLQQERRALRVVPEQLTWQFADNTLVLSFFLPAGSYATVVLRELAVVTDASLQHMTKPDD